MAVTDQCRSIRRRPKSGETPLTSIGTRRLARRVSAEEAARLVKSGDWVEYFSTFSQPDAFDHALAARKAELRDVKIRAGLSVRPRAVLEADPEGAHFQWLNWHFSAYDRRMHDAGISHYIPSNLGEIGDYYLRFIDPPEVAVVRARPMGKDGMFNLGPNSLWHREILARAKVVIVETNEALPHVFDEQAGLHASDVDYVIEGERTAMPALPNAAATELDRAVGRLIVGEIEDGSCLQIGIGGMPNAVCSMLLDSGQKDLGVHTEMMTDGLGELYRAGRITGAAKTLDRGKIVYSFALGTQPLYDTLDGNADFLCRKTAYTNPPHIIMRNDRAVAINNTTQMDLQGQAASESDGHRHISGTGGQAQFVRGAYASAGGKSFICLASTYERNGVRKSRIVLDLTPGNVVTTTRSDMMYVATEYGMANLKGRSVPERAKAMIGLAHPDYREDLSRQAREAGLVPRHYL